MNMKIFPSILALLSINLFYASACKKPSTPAVIEKPAQVRSNYYIDAQNGDDNNSGTSASSPWKSVYNINRQTYLPGDTIFLKAGASWEGRLSLKGSGTAGKPIVLTSYGQGSKPHLMGNGKVNQVLLFEEVDNWEVSNIEISNNTTEIGSRTGILIQSLGSGTRSHFHIKNVYIHDVMGDYSFETRGKNTGGIGIIGGPTTKFDDILIEGCEIGPVNRVGIFTNLTDAKNATRGNRPITNLVIRNNKIHHCAGDGVIVRYANKPIISHNVAYENHNAPESLVKHGVALWCRSTDEALFEYNEVYNTRGSMDGQAFDADLDAYRTIVQYNYSHDNEGGFMLVYGSSSDAIVRYNISSNDGSVGNHIFDFPIWTSPRGSGIFHNNTIIIPAGSKAVLADEAIESAKFYNNIFYNNGSGKQSVPSGGKTAVFVYNAYKGYLSNEMSDSSPLTADPQLVAPLTVPSGLANTGNFKLQATSPYLQNGRIVKQLEPGYWLPDGGLKDFGGTVILNNLFPIGAYKN
jgi:hypothetical protein